MGLGLVAAERLPQCWRWGCPKQGLQFQRGDSEEELQQMQGEERVTERADGVMEPAIFLLLGFLANTLLPSIQRM